MNGHPDISIIIPCYNGSVYITETLNSILSQDENNFEVIAVDDGSTDDSANKIKSTGDERIRYVYQQNQGVSAARNFGLTFATGKYIIFFDADDLMSDAFLSSRKALLENREDIDIVCGEVQKFNDKGSIDGYFRGAAENHMIEDILLYNQDVVTCPSNYLFRAGFLKQNKLLFNPKLSSTADKYFLVQCGLLGKSALIKGFGALKYRVTPNSMSHGLTEKLVLDNEQYYAELLHNHLIPRQIENKSVFLGDFILCAANWKVNKKGKALRYASRAFINNPAAFIKKLF